MPDTLTVRAMNGSEITMDMELSSTVAKLQEVAGSRLGVNHSKELKFVLGTCVLKPGDKLAEVGVQNDSVLTVCKVHSFNVELVDYHGPNSPRFGCTTRAVYELTCSCGYTETFSEQHGYVMDVPSRSISECPQCGAEPCEELKAKRPQMCFSCPAVECRQEEWKRGQEELRAAEAAKWRETVEKHKDQEQYLEKLRELKADKTFQEKYSITLLDAIIPEKENKHGVEGFASFPLADVWSEDSDKCPQSYGLLELRVNQCTPPENRPVKIAGYTDGQSGAGPSKAQKKAKQKAREVNALLAAALTATQPQKKGGKR